MKNMTLKKAAIICGGRLCGNYSEDTELGRVVIDSRAIQSGDLFAAYVGEHVDGHDYISAAFDRGASCCLAQRIPENEDRPILLVPDVQSALEQITAEYRASLSLPVIGITGSVGKTSAKEMISAVLSQRFNILKTDKNLNNQIGVPMTVSRITPEHEAAVIEMGISGFNEMRCLAGIARPDIGVFTVIGHAHLEFLHDLDGVLKAKTEMLEYMDDDALLILNGDDDKLYNLSCTQEKIYFGLSERCNVRAINITVSEKGYSECDIVSGEKLIHAYIPAYGQHMVYAALAGAAVGIKMGLSDKQIEQGIASFELVGRRGAVTDTGFITLVDDSYNANPDSMECGIDSLIKMPGRHVCIFGDMLEQGDQSGEMHYEVGSYAKSKGVDLVIGVGPYSAETCRGAGDNSVHYPDNDSLIKNLAKHIHKGDAVLVKASKGMHIWDVSEALKSLVTDDE